MTAISIIAIGYLCQHFLGVSPLYGIIVAVVVITLYSALGGIQAVAGTDMFQMLIFFVALPVMCAVGLSKAGGIENVFRALPASHLTIDRSNMAFFLSLIFYGLLPYTSIPYIQRALIAKDRQQLAQTFNATGIGLLVFSVFMVLIGLTIYTINPNINPNVALYYFMDNYLYSGVLGLVIAGLLSVIMSTQDSFLNAASTLIAKDICKQIWPSLTDKRLLVIARVSCVCLTILATLISFAQDSILGTFWMIDNFWSPLVAIPLMSGLLGVQIMKKDYIPVMIICTVVVVLSMVITGTFDTRSHTIVVVTSTLTLYIARRRYVAAHPDAKESRIPQMLRHIKSTFNGYVFNRGSVYIFSVTNLVNVIAAIFILPIRADLMVLHVTAICTCVLLLFNELWNDRIKQVLFEKFWYVALLFCLPLVCSYPLFTSKFSPSLGANLGLALILLYILVSPMMFIALTVGGTLLSFIVATNLQVSFISNSNSDTFALYSCFVTTIGILMQVYNKRYISRVVHTEVAKVLEDKVAERTEELRCALDAKREFLGKVSHEVRTPLQGILGISQELAEDWHKFEDAEKHRLIKLVASSGNRLMKLMSNILDLSKFNSGKINAHFVAKVEVSKLIKDAVEEGKTLVENLHKNIRFKVVTDKGIQMHVECDPDKITQVLLNLLDNAITYMESGEVTLRASQDNKYLQIAVRDNGVGIPEHEKLMIFDAFTQSSRTKDPSKGKGLGLAICNEIIKLHGGRIWAENNQDKPGSTFTFVIPYQQEGVKDQILLDEQQPQLRGKVLLIDDEEICLQAITMLLETMGLEVVKMNSGISAIQYLKTQEHDIELILLDLMIPDMYGINVLELIKADKKLKNIPVIIQSGLLDSYEIEKAQRLGAVGHLPKPYTAKVIRSAVQRALSQKQSA
jgi:signal transduction histidine kinase/ActR/RegA family two-component response regulator